MNALRKIQFDEVARAKRICRGGDLGQVKLNHRPACGRQNQNGEAPVTHRVTQGSGRSLVKENLHRCRRRRLAASGGSQTLFGMMQNGLNMFAGHAGEPFQEIIHPRPIFQVLEQHFHRHACALEDPGTANLPGRPFDHCTVTPIKHKGNLVGYRSFSARSRWHSSTSLNASSRFALASTRVSPCEMVAGTFSAKQVYLPSLAGSKTAVNFTPQGYCPVPPLARGLQETDSGSCRGSEFGCNRS